MKAKELDIIQFKPQHHWNGCLAVVTETRDWGVIADLRMPGKVAPIRVKTEDFDIVGQVKE